jgi:16S rRNA (uracil1498-N3)-methyltransferase
VLGRLVDGDGAGASNRPFAVNLFIGPEGGFTPSEIARAEGYGITPVNLGPRILRAETAALALTTLTFAALGDMGR